MWLVESLVHDPDFQSEPMSSHTPAREGVGTLLLVEVRHGK